eukprot:g4306.t1
MDKALTITSIHTFVLRAPLGADRFYSSQASFPERNSMLCKITATRPEEEAVVITGWGEGGQYGPGEPVAAIIDDVLGPMLVGRKVQPTRLWEEMYSATRDFGQRGAYIDAISALDVALWDCLGQSLGLPVSELIGGRHRDSVPVYATGCYYRGADVLDSAASTPALAAEAKGYVDSGFKIVKTKVGLLSIEEDARRIGEIRKAVGPEVKIMVDANHAYNVATATRMAKLLEPLDILFFEEPVPPEDLKGYAKLRTATSIPIAGGECTSTRYGFADLFEAGSVDIAQPDIGACGGISELQKIVTLASIHNILVVPHVWGSGIAVATALQCISALPLVPHSANPIPLQNEPVMEWDRNRNELRDDLLLPFAFQIDKDTGRLVVPDGPGLGVTVNEEVLDRYVVRRGQCPRADGSLKPLLSGMFVEEADTQPQKGGGEGKAASA